MAHYALLDENNIVVSVFVGRDEDDLPEGITDWEEYYAPEGQVVKRTSYNTLDGVHLLGGTPFRGTFAGIGMVYFPDEDVFASPQPYASWTLNAEIAQWEAPIPYPEDGLVYEWDETLGDWVEIQEPSAYVWDETLGDLVEIQEPSA